MAIITISRMFGSGGSDIAGRVAQALGWALLDNAFVDAVAERLGVPRDEISAREERVPSLAERLANAMALGSPEMMPPVPDAPLPPSEERIIEVTKRVVEEAITRGPCVMVGRGAQSMLRERTDTIHVFCYAPKAALVARAVKRLHVAPEEAERIVDETNRNREAYVKKHWHRSWKAHENYHLCVNTEWLGIESTVAMIVRLAKERFGDIATE